MEKPEVKGTVTSLSSMFPPEEAQKASKHVLDTIADRQKELDQLQHFISDNKNLINLVQQIPEQLHHDIMVPFGKAAFFPGRLIHTNEFLVLLGEGYYADRTSKQTAEILKRRGNTLESQVESLKAVMQDLRAEASFFDATAAEAAEGLVEIREDYIEESSSAKVSQTDNKSAAAEDEDEEYTRLFSRMDELEKEELEAENISEHELEEAENINENELDEGDFRDQLSRVSVDQEVKSSDLLGNSMEKPKDVHMTRKLEGKYQQGFPDQLSSEASNSQPAIKDKFSEELHTAFSKSSIFEKEPDAKLQPTPRNEGSALPEERYSDSSKAFTGSIVEHTYNIDRNPKEQTTASTSKVSRFKMQRRQQH